MERTIVSDPGDLRSAWDVSAPDVIAWFRAPEHDSYWLYHRDQFLELLPPPGRRTFDIGCGEGRLSRDLKRLGHSVVALDGSPTMVDAARTGDPSIETRLGDAADLPFEDGSSDLVVLFMCLQDIDDAAGALREAARVLEPGGRLCLAIVHPFNSAGRFEGDEPDSPFVVRGSYLASFRYRDEMERDGLAVTFESQHRSVGWYVDALEAAGFLVERLRESDVPESTVTRPSQRRWQRLPLFLHIRAVRP
jgi:SAM-dependent methyltransferase